MDHKLCASSTAGTLVTRVFLVALFLIVAGWGLPRTVAAYSEIEGAVEGSSGPSVSASEGESSESGAAAAPAADISDRWDSIVSGDSVQPEPAKAASAERDRQPSSGWSDFGEQLFFRLSVDYTHNWVSFTGRPTLWFLGNQGAPFTVNADGTINYPEAFEDNDDRLYTRLTFGTKGFGSDRVNTYFSVVSYNDLDGTSSGSPFISYLDSYDGRSRLSLVNAYVELNGIGGESGFFSHGNLRVGRQYVHSYSNELYPLGASVMDGANVDFRNERFNIGGFVGARSDIFSSPVSRFITGFNFGAALGDKAYFNYDMLYYADSVIQNFTIEPRWASRLGLQGFFRMVENHPVDVGVRTAYAGDKWSFHVNVTDRVSDNDYRYDIWGRSNGDNPSNVVPRLYFTGTQPSFRLSADGNRRVTSWLSLGGRFWLYQLHDETEDTDGFESSFRDYSGNAVIEPAENWEIIGEYRYRDLDRGSPLGAEFFDDIEHAGETNYQEFTGSVGYRSNSRLKAEVGVYYRLFDLQNRLTIIDDSKTNGVFANVFWRINRNVNFRVLYGTDNDYAVFNPDINRQSGLRIGFDFLK